jgi:hypothetical protein
MMIAIAIRRAVMAAAVLGLVVGAAGRARADLLITFDPASGLTIPSTDTTAPIPNGYAGFNWDNFSVLNSSYLGSINSGNTIGIFSMPQAAFNNNAGMATLTSTGGTTFDLTSAYLTSVSVPQTVEVQGFRNGVLDYDVVYSITAQARKFVDFTQNNFTGIDTATFTSLGDPNLGISPQLFVMDNLDLNGSGSAVPELDSLSTASALTLLTSGVLILNGRRKR